MFHSSKAECGKEVLFLVIGLVVAAGIGYLIGQQQYAAPATVPSTTMESVMAEHVFLTPDKLVWKDAPSSIPYGAKLAVLEGKPSEPGPFTMRLQLPPNYKVPPHWHPAIEHVTVLSGLFYVGTGDKFDEAAMMKLPSGSFMMMPVKKAHFARTDAEGAVIQLHGIGPWGINYVNPADDPRNT